MTTPFIAGRATFNDATTLIASHGAGAKEEAASRAARSRDAGNVRRFCHWRQIERVIATLTSDEVHGSIH